MRYEFLKTFLSILFILFIVLICAIGSIAAIIFIFKWISNHPWSILIVLFLGMAGVALEITMEKLGR